MANNFPPDGFEMVTGTWGTDADSNTTTFLSGVSSVELKSTAVATEIRTSEYIPAIGGRGYNVGMMTQGTSVVGAYLFVKVYEYDGSLTLLSTTNVTNLTLLTANTWQRYGDFIQLGATTRYIKIGIAKTTVAQTFLVDSIYADQVKPSFGCYATAQSVSGSTLTLVDLDTAQWNSGGVKNELSASSQIRVEEGGIYDMVGEVTLDNLPAGESMRCMIRISRSGLATYSNYGPWTTAPSTGDCTAQCTWSQELAETQIIRLYVEHTNSGALNTLSGRQVTGLSVSRR